jgi:hypothetical protein
MYDLEGKKFYLDYIARKLGRNIKDILYDLKSYRIIQVFNNDIIRPNTFTDDISGSGVYSTVDEWTLEDIYKENSTDTVAQINRFFIIEKVLKRIELLNPVLVAKDNNAGVNENKNNNDDLTKNCISCIVSEIKNVSNNRNTYKTIKSNLLVIGILLEFITNNGLHFITDNGTKKEYPEIKQGDLISKILQDYYESYAEEIEGVKGSGLSEDNIKRKFADANNLKTLLENTLKEIFNDSKIALKNYLKKIESDKS